jgi:hypothetical protein
MGNCERAFPFRTDFSRDMERWWHCGQLVDILQAVGSPVNVDFWSNSLMFLWTHFFAKKVAAR